MAEFIAGGRQIVGELAEIAARPSGIEERADALLGQLRRLVPFQAARIGLLDPERGAPVSLVSYGYDQAVTAYHDSPAVLEEFELLGLNRAARPICIRDLPVPPSEVPGWVDYLQPAGFREGLAVGLFTSDGRHLGVLGLNTDSPTHPTEAARDLIGHLVPLIAHAVDPLRSIVAVARLVSDSTAGIALTRAGDPLPLPGMSDHPLLAQGSPVLDEVGRQLADGPHHVSFLCPYLIGGGPLSHVRLSVLACLPQPASNAVAVVTVSPPGDLRGLDTRELDILGLLVEGWPNERIAAAVDISGSMVRAHVVQILHKLGVRTRTSAAVRALNRGMYVPYSLVHCWDLPLPRGRTEGSSTSGRERMRWEH